MWIYTHSSRSRFYSNSSNWWPTIYKWMAIMPALRYWICFVDEAPQVSVNNGSPYIGLDNRCNNRAEAGGTHVFFHQVHSDSAEWWHTTPPNMVSLISLVFLCFPWGNLLKNAPKIISTIYVGIRSVQYVYFSSQKLLIPKNPLGEGWNDRSPPGKGVCFFCSKVIGRMI